MVKPAKKREIVDYIKQEYSMSIRQACTIVDLNRSSYYYYPSLNKDSVLIEELNKLAELYPSYGFKKMYNLLRKKGYKWNHKKVYRVYKHLGLNLKRRVKRRIPTRQRVPLDLPKRYNQVWSMDFMSDALFNNRRFRTLNLIDDYNRECIWIETTLSIGAHQMVNLLDWIIKERGKPKAIRVDNGPEFTSIVFSNWCHKNRIEIRYIQPGKSTQNAFIERFNRSYRSEVLDIRCFENMVEVREITLQWITHYNETRPHESLKNLSLKDKQLKYV